MSRILVYNIDGNCCFQMWNHYGPSSASENQTNDSFRKVLCIWHSTRNIQKLPKPRCQRNAVHSKGMQKSKEFQGARSLAYRASIQEHKIGVSLACARRAPAPELWSNHSNNSNDSRNDSLDFRRISVARCWAPGNSLAAYLDTTDPPWPSKTPNLRHRRHNDIIDIWNNKCRTSQSHRI